jgi:hypothetical protein
MGILTSHKTTDAGDAVMISSAIRRSGLLTGIPSLRTTLEVADD